MAIPWNTVLTTVVGILISVFTGYLSLKVRQLDQKNQAYRKEREEKEAEEAEKQKVREQAINKLTLGMARTMLLNNYQACLAKGYYSIDQREVYHELYQAYRQDSGNGIIQQISHKIVELPTEPPKD